jgi:hypothetical protein
LNWVEVLFKFETFLSILRDQEYPTQLFFDHKCCIHSYFYLLHLFHHMAQYSTFYLPTIDNSFPLYLLSKLLSPRFSKTFPRSVFPLFVKLLKTSAISLAFLWMRNKMKSLKESWRVNGKQTSFLILSSIIIIKSCTCHYPMCQDIRPTF